MRAKTQKTTKPFAKPEADKNEAPRLVVNAKGIIFYTNKALQVMAGSKKPLKGQKLVDILHFEDPDEAFRSAWLFGDSAGSKSDFIQSLQSGAHKVCFDASGQCTILQFDWVEAPDGKRFLVASTEEKDDSLTKKVIALSKEEGSTEDISGGNIFLELSHDITAITKADGTFVQVNHNFHDVLGYNAQALETLNFLDLVHDDDKASVRAALQHLIHDDEGNADHMIDFECRMISATEKSKTTEWRGKRHGKHIYCVGRDVSAVRKQALTLDRQQQQILEAESIGHMGHWYWRVGEDDIEWSDEIYSIFGVTRGEFEPSMDNVNAMLHKNDAARMMQAFQRAMIQQNNYDMDFRIIRPDHEIRYVRCEGRCELDSEGEVIALFGIMQDITERTLHELDLKDAKDAAERAYAAKSQFLANMSHELRTPLNAIIGFSEMIERQLLGPVGTERYLDYIKGIRESGEHLLDLISDILDMSKIEAGKYSLDLEQVSPNKVIKLAVHMMEGRALDTEVKLTTEIKNEDRQIIADRRAVMQILLNLLSNAVKFSKQGGAVSVTCLDQKTGISITVADEGIGIPAHKLQAITRPFEQAASHYTRDHEGSGLGLAITKELVELHGGSMDIESTVDIGTTVTIHLPFDAGKTRQDHQPREEDAA